MDQQTSALQDHRKAVYSVVLRNKTPKLNAGETVLVDVYLVGYGIPARNKLHIQWSSDDVIDQKQPGVIQAWLALGVHEATKRKVPIKRDKPQEIRLIPDEGPHSGGLTIGLFSEMFLRPLQVPEPKNNEFERVASELMWDDKPPLLLKLKTSADAPSGDYEISFTFTYADGQGISQHQRPAQFHLRDWPERNPWIVPIALVIAFLSLVVTAIAAIPQIAELVNKLLCWISQK